MKDNSGGDLQNGGLRTICYLGAILENSVTQVRIQGVDSGVIGYDRSGERLKDISSSDEPSTCTRIW